MKGRLAHRIPILRLSVFLGTVFVVFAGLGAAPYLRWWTIGLVPVLAAIVSWLETRDQLRRLGPGQVSPPVEGAKVFIWVLVSVLTGVLAMLLLGGLLLSFIP